MPRVSCLVVAMSMRTVNLTLLAILILTGLSGIGTFLVGSPQHQWMFWLHRIASLAIVPLLFWKTGIVIRSYRKRGVTFSTALSALGVMLFAGTFAYGLLWATVGIGGGSLPVLGAASGLGIHVALAAAFLPVLLIHVLDRWPLVRLRRPDFLSRRAALRYLALGTAGLLLWQSAETATARGDWSGTERRFTGSRPRGRFTGNDYPVVNWFTDPVPGVDADAWQLRIDGLVERELTLSLDDLSGLEARTHRAVLDCTGGWFSEQRWTGVPVLRLLDEAGRSGSARSLVVESVTGYRRRYALDEAEDLLLAYQVEDESLSQGHGYPVRLVAPGHRGYDWVKWVTTIEVSDLPAWFEAPLPLQ